MPSLNTVREFEGDQFCHVYNRGVEKRDIFLDDQDFTVFLGLLKKYLTGEKTDKHNRRAFTHLGEDVSLLAYCLMPNHFHLLLHQNTKDGTTKLMRRLSTGYVMYFNNRYNRVGGLFQSRYKASVIDKDEYLHHVSRYIHLNPKHYQYWPYSSFSYYEGKKQAAWLKPELLLSFFDGGRQEYINFVADYEDSKKELSSLKWQLANGAEM